MDKERSSIKICIVSYNLNLHDEIATKINSLLVNNGIIAVDTFTLDIKKDISLKGFYSAGVLILDDNSPNEKQVEDLNLFFEKCKLFVINIGENKNKYIEKIKCERIIDIKLYDTKSLEILFQEIYNKYSS